MKTDKSEAEPSMDEILASIRQIISTDSPDGKSNFLESKDDEDILDLTHVLPEEKKIPTHLKNSKTEDSFVHSSKAQDLHLTNSKTAYEKKIVNEDPLVSPKVASETAEAFHSLNKIAQEEPRYTLNKEIGGQTIEDLVRESLKPLLKEWLDTNLPTLVRWVVNEQVERIMRQARVSQNERSSEKEKS
ncbi:MAG: DUF2497 domain-containing protein [Proteobacteria bacterium]|nr:DUF2497 domain-containing protein [Pseudomonadota bacterium]